MKSSNTYRRISACAIVSALAITLAAVPLLSRAGSPTTTLNVVNNSSRAINHLYLSPVSNDNWSGDQLSSPIGAGQSADLNNLACSQGQVKVIGEDQDGCFSTFVIACDESSTWTVTDATARDCGN